MAPKRQRQKEPLRYPRKLRHTLERIRSEDVDESGEDAHRGTLWGDFYAHRKGGTTQIKLMHGLIDDSAAEAKHHRLFITNQLEVNETKVRRPKPITIRAPWEVKHETPGSE